MYRLSSLLVVSCALLSTFVLPSICSPSSSSTSFVVAAPSNALFRDSIRLTDRLNQILLEINSVLDSEDQNQDDEEQEELADEQEIQQSVSEDPLEDLTEGNQIIGTINEADAPWKGWGRTKTPEEAKRAEEKAAKRAQEFANSKEAVNSFLLKSGSTIGNGFLYPFVKAHQWHGRYLSAPARQARSDKRAKKRLDDHRESLRKMESDYAERQSRSGSRSNSGRIHPEPVPETEQQPNLG